MIIGRKNGKDSVKFPFVGFDSNSARRTEEIAENVLKFVKKISWNHLEDSKILFLYLQNTKYLILIHLLLMIFFTIYF